MVVHFTKTNERPNEFRPEDKLGQYGKGEIVEGDGVRQDGPAVHFGGSMGASGSPPVFRFLMLVFFLALFFFGFKEFSSKKV